MKYVSAFVISLIVIPIDRAGGEPTPADAPPESAPAPVPPTAGDPGENSGGEVIEVHGVKPADPGTTRLDAGAARKAPGALGEPIRALALLPGVTTSIAAVGYPIIRGTLPGESRFTFDGIQLPMLYHFLLGTQVIHPSFIGDLELRAGGHGAEQGHLIGGHVALTPARQEATRTEIRASPLEIGAFRAQALTDATSAAVAARVGTLTAAARIYDTSTSLYYVDQQTRIVHRLGSGDALTLTSLGAFDYLGRPQEGLVEIIKLGFHRLDGRWTRERTSGSLRAGVETSLDVARSVKVYAPPEDPSIPPTRPHREGGRSYGVRAYADGRLRLAPWLGVRGGIEARHRTLVHGSEPFQFTESTDPYLGLARRVDAQGGWAAFDVRAGGLTITPGIRADVYHADLYGASVRHVTVDPRLAIEARLPRGARAELAVGMYAAPPQATLSEEPVVVGPLPMTDGAGSSGGMNRGVQGQVSIRTPLPGGLEGSVAAYYRDMHYAVDFGIGDKIFEEPCRTELRSAHVYRNIDTRSVGVEVMLRRDVGRSVSGWLSYSLAKVDRDFGFIQLPGEYDQRHTLNATAQWRRGRWTLGTTGHLHTGRALLDPQVANCMVTGLPDPVTYSFTSLHKLRRPPLAWRVDLRAERAFRFADWRMNLFFELQNASFTKEIVGYDYDTFEGRMIERTVFLLLPMVGLEVLL